MKKQEFGITADKETDFPEWYQQVITKSELLEYYDVKGCCIMRPLAQFMWNQIKKWFDNEIEKLGFEECYFPMLITKSSLEKEKSHIENFSPEVAWITQCGDEILHDPVAIRPTSETIMYPYFAKWIKSHKDLPLKLNQWCNVLRWELRGTLPFIRGKEFLWQEGHTVHLTQDEADKEVLKILDLYYNIYKDLLAIPVIKGKKSEFEKFGGADYTTSIEAFIPGSGRNVQAATSHSLGTNFSKMFDVKIHDEETNTTKYLYQTSWGITTRSLGIAVMIHSDNLGLVLPPRVAKIQVVIIPCGINKKTSDVEIDNLMDNIKRISNELSVSGIRVHVDDRKGISPGYKFNHWELRGVPLRIEVGFRDLSNEEVVACKRHNSSKSQVKIINISSSIKSLLNDIHNEMYEKAYKEMAARITYTDDFNTLMSEFEKKNLVMAPWCLKSSCETDIKQKTTVVDECSGKIISTGAKSLCIPFDAKACDGKQCIICGDEAVKYALFGKSY